MGFITFEVHIEEYSFKIRFISSTQMTVTIN